MVKPRLSKPTVHLGTYSCVSCCWQQSTSHVINSFFFLQKHPFSPVYSCFVGGQRRIFVPNFPEIAKKKDLRSNNVHCIVYILSNGIHNIHSVFFLMLLCYVVFSCLRYLPFLIIIECLIMQAAIRKQMREGFLNRVQGPTNNIFCTN